MKKGETALVTSLLLLYMSCGDFVNEEVRLKSVSGPAFASFVYLPVVST